MDYALGSHIPSDEIRADITDTWKEIDDYRDEKDVLMRNPIDNKVRIYLLEGRILQREEFVKHISAILRFRGWADHVG